MESQVSRLVPETIAVSMLLLVCALAVLGSGRVLSGPWVARAQVSGIVLGAVCLVLLGVLVARIRR